MKKLASPIVIYKSGKYCKLNKCKNGIGDRNIECILIPYEDYPNGYIPIRPSDLYVFDTATISIDFQAINYDVDDDGMMTGDVRNFTKDITNLSELIHSLYNIVKFSSTRNILMNYSNYGQGCSLGILPIKMSLSIISLGKVIFNLNLKYDPREGLNDEVLDGSLAGEDYFLDEIRDFFFINDRQSTIPHCIRLNDDKRWDNIRKRSNLEDDDLIMIYNTTYSIYMIVTKIFIDQVEESKNIVFNILLVDRSWMFGDSIGDKVDVEKLPNDRRRDLIESYISKSYDDFQIALEYTFECNRDIEMISTFIIFYGTIVNTLEFCNSELYSGPSESDYNETILISYRYFPESAEYDRGIILTKTDITKYSLHLLMASLISK